MMDAYVALGASLVASAYVVTRDYPWDAYVVLGAGLVALTYIAIRRWRT